MLERLWFWLFRRKDCSHMCMICEYYEHCKEDLGK